MLSQKCKYAIRTILYLAVESKMNEKKRLADISAAMKIPSPYLGKILQDLVSKKILSSVKGPNGGFFLSEKNKKILVIEIIEAIDGLSVFESCGLGLESCSSENPCPVHTDFKIGRDHLMKTFSGKSIEELAADIRFNSFFLVR